MNLIELSQERERASSIGKSDRTAADVQILIDYHEFYAKWNLALAKDPPEGTTADEFERVAAIHRNCAKFYGEDLAYILKKGGAQ